MSEDSIVRVQARELRKRLTAYFDAEGKDEPLVLTIPKGGYVPQFSPRGATARSHEPAAEADEPVQETSTPAVVQKPAGSVPTQKDASVYTSLLGPMGLNGQDISLVLSNPRVILYFGSSEALPQEGG